MKFLHIADCHIGGWREEKLEQINQQSFTYVIDQAIKEKVDFILIAGDLFNTSFPSIDSLKFATKELMRLKSNNIRCYIVAGSHDYSPSGKTMLSVLEEARLVKNIAKAKEKDGKLFLEFTKDPAGAKICGMLGKRLTLEKSYYEILDRDSLENEEGFTIFLFHSGITEFMPGFAKEADSIPLSLLPKGFDYYAGGHIHYFFQTKEKHYGTIAYPGPTFPNNFSELERLKSGGYYIVEKELDLVSDHKKIRIKEIMPVDISCENKTPNEIEQFLIEKIENTNINNKIVTIRLHGKLSEGKLSDIDFKLIMEKAKDAYIVLRNTQGVNLPEFEAISLDRTNIEEIEERLINEHAGQQKLANHSTDRLKHITKSLISSTLKKRKEGQTKNVFEKQIIEEIEKILDLE